MTESERYLERKRGGQKGQFIKGLFFMCAHPGNQKTAIPEAEHATAPSPP